MLARLQILAAALIFSTGGAAIKATSLTGWQVASFRCAVAGLVLLLVTPRVERRWSWGAPLVGLAYAGTLVFYALANKLTTAANTIFLHSTAPLFILLLAPWLLRERLRRADLVYMGALVAGLVVLFAGPAVTAPTAPDPARGNVLALVSGISWAVLVIGLRWLGRSGGAGGAGTAVIIGNAIAFLVCLPLALPVIGAGGRDWAIVLYLGVIQIGLAYVLLTSALRTVPAFEASLLILVEPVFNPIWAWLAHGESPGRYSILGGALILLATAVKTLYGLRFPPTRADSAGRAAPGDPA